MTKPIIAVDIDDVLADGTVYVIDSVNHRHGLTLTKDDYHAVGGEFWGYYERVWQTYGVGDIVRYADIAEEFRLDQSSVPLVPGADDAIRELSRRFKVLFITARPEEWSEATRRWLKHHFDGQDVELYFAGNTVSLEQKQALTKGEQAKLLGAQLLIDDNIGNCQTAMDEDIGVILFGDYGWQDSAPADMKRCKDWAEVLEYLNEAGI